MSTILRAPERLTAAEEGRHHERSSWLVRPTATPTAAGRASDEVIDAFADLDVTIIDPQSDRWPTLEVGLPWPTWCRSRVRVVRAAAFDADEVIVWVPSREPPPRPC